jgi:SWI/SNF-related matrix-associated actin-dependent regulator of chromatin subfamily A-like protein 1
MPPELFDFQEEGIKWLMTRKCALLADRPRLGKSVQTIVAADRLKLSKILIICKAIARRNWQNEFEIWGTYGRRFEILYGESFGPVTIKENTVYIISYEAAKFMLNGLIGEFDLLVGDESHSLKNLEAQRTQFILGKNGLCRRAKRVWLLTGTPVSNHAGELWSQMFTFGATKFSYGDFVNRYCNTFDSGYGLKITGTKTDKHLLTELQTSLNKIMLRRTEDQVKMQLPKISMSSVLVDPGPVDLKITSFFRYMIPHDRSKELEEIVAKELGLFKSIVRKAGGVQASDQLLEVLKAEAKSVSTLRRYTALQKLEPAIELIRAELESNAYRKCVIFGVHKDMILGTQIRLPEFKPVTMYGGSNPNSVERNLKKFQNPNSKCRVFIGNIMAAGTSISLDAANHIFFLEESWVPSDNAQAIMRCSSNRQKNPIFVRNFVLKNSYDQKIQALLQKKTSEIAKIYADNGESLADFL